MTFRFSAKSKLQGGATVTVSKSNVATNTWSTDNSNYNIVVCIIWIT